MARSIRNPWRVLPAVALFAAAPAPAHHSFAMFDAKKEVTLVGEVAGFQWTNPHSWLQLTIPAIGGQPPIEYSIELGSPNTISRQGWRRTSFKPGDRVSVIVHPMRDGSAGGAFVSAIDAQGRKLPLQ